MGDRGMATGAPKEYRAPALGLPSDLGAPLVTSEIVIVDDDGNEEPYDPGKLPFDLSKP